MKRLSSALLVAVGLASSSAAFAQSSYYPSGNGYDNGYQQGEAHYDYARVIRVDPVLDGRYSSTSGYSTSGYNRNGQRCYQSTTAGSYERDGYYRNDDFSARLRAENDHERILNLFRAHDMVLRVAA